MRILKDTNEIQDGRCHVGEILPFSPGKAYNLMLYLLVSCCIL